MYLPPDANCLLSVMDHCLRSRHYVNVVIAGKHLAPQWLTMDAAVKHCTEGIGIGPWASNDEGVAPDVVMACCGDVPTLETLAAVSIMREHLPDLKIRVVNAVDLMKLQPQTKHPHGLSDVFLRHDPARTGGARVEGQEVRPGRLRLKRTRSGSAISTATTFALSRLALAPW